MKVLRVNVEKEKYYEEEAKAFGPINYSINYHTINKTYKSDALSPDNALCIGAGPFTPLGVPGTFRLIISAKSPQLQTFFLTTLGGGGIELVKTGFKTIIIEGKAESMKAVIIKREKNKLKVLFEGVKELPVNVYKLQEDLNKKCAKIFKKLEYRILAVGPAALNTNMGAINSLQIKNNKLNYGSEGWAGRGGFGSVLLQAHNVAAVAFGGDFKEDKKFEPEPFFQENFDKPMMKTIYDATEKYRYVEKIKTGGTYGVNFSKEADKVLWFNWGSIKLDKKIRTELYEKNIRNHFLKQFNNTIIKKKLFKTCGEVCPAVCKKVRGRKIKRDYEPSAACGPQCGIFDMYHVEKVVSEVDKTGFDAIEVGNCISYIFEGVSKGLLKKEDFFIKKLPVMNPKLTLKDSLNNSRIAVKLVRDIGRGRIKLFSKGLRHACKELKYTDAAIYMSYGDEGVVSPCVYFVPGFIVPLPIQGKFHTYYGKEFLEPYELGRKSLERAVKELYFEEGGVCRFHRGWAENLLPLFAKKMGVKDFQKHAENLFEKIKKYNKLAGAEPVYFETLKTKELLYYHLLSYLEDNKSEAGLKWKKLFEKDFESASKKYWSELLRGVKK